eukprot:7704156-Alexandrium_andersonii.AAC.1
MSASLVGSEMCIRDRGWSALRRALDQHRAAARGQEPLPRAKPQQKRCACLLYTSDAADDM